VKNASHGEKFGPGPNGEKCAPYRGLRAAARIRSQTSIPLSPANRRFAEFLSPGEGRNSIGRGKARHRRAQPLQNVTKYRSPGNPRRQIPPMGVSPEGTRARWTQGLHPSAHLPPTPRPASGLVCYFRLFPGLRSPTARFTPGYRLSPFGLENSARIRSQAPIVFLRTVGSPNFRAR